MRTRVWVVLVAVLSALVALVAVRSLATAALAAMIAGLSASAVAAGTGKAGSAAMGLHIPALMGAVVGSLLLSLQLRDKPWPERMILLGASCVAAYFGGLAAGEWWGLGYGSIGLAGTFAAYLLLAVLNMLLTLLRDVGWIKSLIGNRLGGG